MGGCPTGLLTTVKACSSTGNWNSSAGAKLEDKQNFEFIKCLRKLGEAFAGTDQCQLSSGQPTTEDP